MTPTTVSTLIVIAAFVAAPSKGQEDVNVFAPSPAVTRYIEDALQFMEGFSIKRDEIDWPSFRAETLRSASGAESIEGAHAVLRDAIRRLGDRHSQLIPPQRASLQNTAGATTEDLPWWAPTSERFNERISYVQVTSYIGSNSERKTRYADELQAAIRAVDSETTCGWIVDLRSNGGGNVFPMAAGIGPLAGEGELSGSINANGEAAIRWYRDGRVGVGNLEQARVSGNPYILQNPDPPVAVLIGPGTASSGEATALSFIGRANTRVFGRPSAGLTTANAPFQLEDRAILNLAVAVMMDRSGKAYGGSIEPDQRVEDQDINQALADQPDVQQAAAWLNEHPSCRE